MTGGDAGANQLMEACSGGGSSKSAFMAPQGMQVPECSALSDDLPLSIITEALMNWNKSEPNVLLDSNQKPKDIHKLQ